MERAAVELKIAIQKSGRRGLGVDLDEVTSNTVYWWMGKMLEEFGHSKGFSLDQMMTEYRYVQLVEEWQDRPEINQWIEHHRTSNEVQEQLPLIEGADEFARRIDAEVEPIAAYITARPESVRLGTQRWLDQHQFPRAPLIMKSSPSASFQDNHIWKAGVLSYLYPEVSGIVDDNPGLIEYLPDSYQGKIFLFGGAACTRNGLKVYECRDWAAVHSRMVQLKAQQQ